MPRTLPALLALACATACLVEAGEAKKPQRPKKPRKQYWTATDPIKAGEDFEVQGEYVGDAAVAAQVIAMGAGRFQAVFYQGGLPGAGWSRGKPCERVNSQLADDGPRFQGKRWQAVLKDGQLTVHDAQGGGQSVLKRTVRRSPTLGMKPPAGAVVLFDGTSPDAFPRGRMTEDGLLTEGVTTQRAFGGFRLHLEFRPPFMPTAKGQARGNSGAYLQRRYEVQILDSFGLDGKHNECGGIYKVKAPDVNMCLPPLSWQTYDIDFTAPKFDEAGNKTANARLTVRHNGVVIHSDVEVPHKTGSGRAEGPAPGPLCLQNHGNPVRFRNIWVVEKK